MPRAGRQKILPTKEKTPCPVPTLIVFLLASFWILAGAQGLHAEDPKAKAKSGADDPYQWKSLFDGKSLEGWKVPSFGGEGTVKVEDGAIVLGLGESMTGIAWDGWELPKVDYEVTLEGKRTDGVDFLLRLPVNDTVQLRGWWLAGTVTGLERRF